MIADKNVAVEDESEEYLDIEDHLYEQFKEMKIEGSLNSSNPD